MARSLGARSITMVEAGHYDPSDRHHRREAASAFGALCDRAADHDLLVHIEPFAWSSLGRIADAMAIVTGADRPNGGLLLDLWHHVRGPDRGRLPPGFDHERVFGIQLADTLAAPWSNVRNECMNRRLLPGDGHGRLADRLAELADHGPLPPVGVEVFGEAMAGQPPVEAAATAFESMTTVFVDAGL